MADEKKEKEPKTGQKKPVKKQPTQKEEARRRVYRSRANRMIGGVCGGFAQYLNVDPIIIRIVWAIAVVWGGVGVIAYILSWIIIPENSGEEEVVKKTDGGKKTGLIWGVILIAIGCLFMFRGFDWFDFYPFHFRWHWGDWMPGYIRLGRFDIILPILIIALGVIYLVNVLRKSNESNNPKGEKPSGGKPMQKKLTRSVTDKMIGGVCGGVAEYFNVDPSIVRVLWAIVTLAGFPLGLIAYIVMMIVVPEESAVESTGTGSKATAAKAKK